MASFPKMMIIDLSEYDELEAIRKKFLHTEETISRAIEYAIDINFRFDKDLPKAERFLSSFAAEMKKNEFNVSFTAPTEGETTVKIEKA
jgi:hypothetical protein